jgi:hypothetical protein
MDGRTVNLELAQELKEAGFPNIKECQRRQGREFIILDGSVPVYSLGDAEYVDDSFVPILEELIEACWFDGLLAYRDTGDWEATSEKIQRASSKLGAAKIAPKPWPVCGRGW